MELSIDRKIHHHHYLSSVGVCLFRLFVCLFHFRFQIHIFIIKHFIDDDWLIDCFIFSFLLAFFLLFLHFSINIHYWPNHRLSLLSSMSSSILSLSSSSLSLLSSLSIADVIIINYRLSIINVQILGSKREYHFQHRAIPHARTKRNIGHYRKLRSDHLVSFFFYCLKKIKQNRLSNNEIWHLYVYHPCEIFFSGYFWPTYLDNNNNFGFFFWKKKKKTKLRY